MSYKKKTEKITREEQINTDNEIKDWAQQFIHRNIKLLAEKYKNVYQGAIELYEELDKENMIEVKGFVDNIADIIEFTEHLEQNSQLWNQLHAFNLEENQLYQLIQEIHRQLNENFIFSRLLLKFALQRHFPDEEIRECEDETGYWMYTQYPGEIDETDCKKVQDDFGLFF